MGHPTHNWLFRGRAHTGNCVIVWQSAPVIQYEKSRTRRVYFADVCGS